MRFAQRQRGLTLWSGLFVLLVGGFVALVALKVIPGYLEYFRIAETLEGIRGEAASSGMTAEEIRKRIGRRFSVEDIRDRDVSDVVIKAQRGGLTQVSIDYEFRRNLFYNIDLVLRFDKAVEVKGRW